jgi:hypothetical protein
MNAEIFGTTGAVIALVLGVLVFAAPLAIWARLASIQKETEKQTRLLEIIATALAPKKRESASTPDVVACPLCKSSIQTAVLKAGDNACPHCGKNFWVT